MTIDHASHVPIQIHAQDAQAAAKRSYDVCVVGSGILGSALSASLARSGRSVLLIERDLQEPDRIVGELLQPGGCMALRKLGLDDCLEGIDSVPVEGYKVFWGADEVAIPYPEERVEMNWSTKNDADESDRKQEGRSFHHGRFVQKLRQRASTTEGVTMIEATVNELVKNEKGRYIGVRATPKKSDEQLKYSARMTIVTDGCFSKFRRELLPAHVSPTVRSNFVGLILEDPDLPAPNHGHVILGKKDISAPPAAKVSTGNGPDSIGPVLVYQLSTHETRMLVDVPGSKVPSVGNGDLAAFLAKHVTPVLPSRIVPSFESALEKSKSGDKTYRLRSMPNSFLPPFPQGRFHSGAFLAGDSLNMRHPLTGGGMTVAMNDALILTELLGGGKKVHEAEPDTRGVVDLDYWDDVCERLEEWHWSRKSVATCINILAQALYSLFGADDDNLEVLKTGCFKYFERGGECINGPVSLLSAITPSPVLLFYHFFSVAFYSIYILFTNARPSANGASKATKPGAAEYPALALRSLVVFWTACKVFLPVMWSEAQL